MKNLEGKTYNITEEVRQRVGYEYKEKEDERENRIYLKGR